LIKRPCPKGTDIPNDVNPALGTVFQGLDNIVLIKTSFDFDAIPSWNFKLLFKIE
jgi:hypothetical protein